MSDDKIEQEQNATPSHPEISETPFNADNPPETPAADEPQAEQDKPAEAPEAQQPAEEPKETAEQEQPAEPLTMESAMAQMENGVDYGGTFKALKEGEVVDGVVVHIDREGILVDVGTKSEGIVRPGELSRDPSLNPEDVAKVGEKIKVYVMRGEGQDGGPVLSKKRADFEKTWERVQQAHVDGELLKAMVTDRVKGGLVVDLGIRGFVPASHVGSGRLQNLEKFVGQSMQFKVIEVDRERRKVVLSNRIAVDEQRSKEKKETLANLKEGQVREGVVRRITDYGAFIDLGGVDGLLHISEMSWTRIKHPSDVVKPGQKLNVMVLKMNLERERVSLGLRQILPDPWTEIPKLYTVGDTINGTVTRLVPFGAFVQVEGGVEGIIPNAELATRRVKNPEEVVSVGQEVEIKVIDLRPEERRLTLSIRQLHAQKERTREQSDYREYNQRAPESKTTIGDLFGDRLGDYAASVSDEKAKAPKPSKKRARVRAAEKEAVEEAEALAEAEEMLTKGEDVVEEKAQEPEAAETEVKEEAEAPADEEKAEEKADDKKEAKQEAKPDESAEAQAEEKADEKAEEKPKKKTTTRKKKETEDKAEAKAKKETKAKAKTKAKAEAKTEAKDEAKAEAKDDGKDDAKAEGKEE